MAQFDVYRVRGGGLVVDCQTDALDSLPTRLVVPLRPRDKSAMGRLTPAFRVEGKDYILYTPLAGAVAARSLDRFVVSLAEHEYAIKGALDILTNGV